MRRTDRQVTDLTEIAAILERCQVCHLGLTDGDIPYVVPLNYGYELEGDTLTLYFHCAKEGYKLDLLARNPKVCFEMDDGHALVPGARACDYSYRYESIIGFGSAEILDAPAEKSHALRVLMAHYSKGEDFPFSQRALDIVTVFRVCSRSFTAKRH